MSLTHRDDEEQAGSSEEDKLSSSMAGKTRFVRLCTSESKKPLAFIDRLRKVIDRCAFSILLVESLRKVILNGPGGQLVGSEVVDLHAGN